MNGQLETDILVDTCFLISLVNEDDSLHRNAENYFRWGLAQKANLYLSTITLSEFQQKQEPGIIENFQILPFGLEESASQHQHFSRNDVGGRSSAEKAQVKDDIRIIATCLARGIGAVLTADDDLIGLAKRVGLRVIDYRVPLSSYLGQLPLGG